VASDCRDQRADCLTWQQPAATPLAFCTLLPHCAGNVLRTIIRDHTAQTTNYLTAARTGNSNGPPGNEQTCQLFKLY